MESAVIRFMVLLLLITLRVLDTPAHSESQFQTKRRTPKSFEIACTQGIDEEALWLERPRKSDRTILHGSSMRAFGSRGNPFLYLLQ